MEVQPILEVLVGKTVEQALIEVLEEEELAALREQQRRFLETRAVETAEAQRLEERERRLQAEKDRRMMDMADGLKTQKEMEERIAASVLMQGYMADMLPSVLEGLEEEGFLLDNIKQGKVLPDRPSSPNSIDLIRCGRLLHALADERSDQRAQRSRRQQRRTYG